MTVLPLMPIRPAFLSYCDRFELSFFYLPGGGGVMLQSIDLYVFFIIFSVPFNLLYCGLYQDHFYQSPYPSHSPLSSTFLYLSVCFFWFFFLRYSELACSATPHPALTLGLSLRTSSFGPASFQSIGLETSSGRRQRGENVIPAEEPESIYFPTKQKNIQINIKKCLTKGNGTDKVIGKSGLGIVRNIIS